MAVRVPQGRNERLDRRRADLPQRRGRLRAHRDVEGHEVVARIGVQHAAEALGSLGDPEAKPALRERLKETNGEVCRAAATALGNLLVQVRASGEISTLAESRQVVRQSSRVREYLPRSSSAWDEAAAKLGGKPVQTAVQP